MNYHQGFFKWSTEDHFFFAGSNFKSKRKCNQLQNNPLGHECMGKWIMQLIHAPYMYIINNEMFQVLVW